MKEASNRGAQGLAVSGFAHWTQGPVDSLSKARLFVTRYQGLTSASSSEDGFRGSSLTGTSQAGLLGPLQFWKGRSEVHMLDAGA